MLCTVQKLQVSRPKHNYFFHFPFSKANPTLTYPQHALLDTGTVACTVTLIIWKVCQFVAPFLQHVESLGMPDMCLQPNMLPLPAGVVLKQVARPPTVFARWTLGLHRWGIHHLQYIMQNYCKSHQISDPLYLVNQ